MTSVWYIYHYQISNLILKTQKMFKKRLKRCNRIVRFIAEGIIKEFLIFKDLGILNKINEENMHK